MNDNTVKGSVNETSTVGAETGEATVEKTYTESEVQALLQRESDRRVSSALNKQKKEFENLKGLIYFTDGYGIYPERMPDYDVIFAFLNEDPNRGQVPNWALEVVIDEETLEDCNRAQVIYILSRKQYKYNKK